MQRIIPSGIKRVNFTRNGNLFPDHKYSLQVRQILHSYWEIMNMNKFEFKTPIIIYSSHSPVKTFITMFEIDDFIKRYTGDTDFWRIEYPDDKIICKKNDNSKIHDNFLLTRLWIEKHEDKIKANVLTETGNFSNDYLRSICKEHKFEIPPV